MANDPFFILLSVLYYLLIAAFEVATVYSKKTGKPPHGTIVRLGMVVFVLGALLSLYELYLIKIMFVPVLSVVWIVLIKIFEIDTKIYHWLKS